MYLRIIISLFIFLGAAAGLSDGQSRQSQNQVPNALVLRRRVVGVKTEIPSRTRFRNCDREP